MKPMNHNLLLEKLSKENSAEDQDGLLDRYLAQEERLSGLSEQMITLDKEKRPLSPAIKKSPTKIKKPASGDSPTVKKIGDSD